MPDAEALAPGRRLEHPLRPFPLIRRRGPTGSGVSVASGRVMMEPLTEELVQEDGQEEKPAHRAELPLKRGGPVDCRDARFWEDAVATSSNAIPPVSCVAGDRRGLPRGGWPAASSRPAAMVLPLRGRLSKSQGQGHPDRGPPRHAGRAGPVEPLDASRPEDAAGLARGQEKWGESANRDRERLKRIVDDDRDEARAANDDRLREVLAAGGDSRRSRAIAVISPGRRAAGYLQFVGDLVEGAVVDDVQDHDQAF